MNLKICLLAIYMFVVFLLNCSWLSLLVFPGRFYPCWSLITLCILRILTLCLQVTDIFSSACCGPCEFVYLFQILTWYQVSQWENFYRLLYLPEKSSVHWRLAAFPHHKPSSCFRSRFRRDFPNILLGSAFRGGPAHSTEMVSSHSILEF